MITRAYQGKIRQDSSTDADDPDMLYRHIAANQDWSRQNSKRRFENMVLKSDAIAAGVSEVAWSELVWVSDPLTGEKHQERRDFAYAISCRELLNLTPVWQKAADGHDVSIPVSLSSRFPRVISISVLC